LKSRSSVTKLNPPDKPLPDPIPPQNPVSYQQLAERGIETEEFTVEDWGCYLPVKNEGFRLALCCGHQDGDEDQFLVFTEPSTPKVKKFFRTIDATAPLTRLLDAVREILSADPDTREIVWCNPQ
jgi:hypothetical protein